MKSLKVMEGACNGQCSNNVTSSRVIVTSSTDIWKILVSLCHLFAKAYISLRSPVSSKHAIRGLNHVAATKPSISRVVLPNFSTFLPWDKNFNSRHSWK